ncbi:MAG: DUF1501 domain-containing protein [bacterium]
MNHLPDYDKSQMELSLARRHFLKGCPIGLGSMALASLGDGPATGRLAAAESAGEWAGPHFAPKAKAVIFLFMAGGPSQFELFEPKPKLNELSGQVPPESFVKGKRFAFLKPGAKLLGSREKFSQQGQCGMDLSERLPYHSQIVDELCWLRGMNTDVFNHGPAKGFLNTGSPQFGRPSMGSWVSYGLGSECRDLPSFIVLQSGPRGPRGGAALWSSGFLPTQYQGVPFLKGNTPILDLAPPQGRSRQDESEFYGALGELNRLRQQETADPEIATRIAAYEMAFRMQATAPELVEVSGESPLTLKRYGVEPGKPSYAMNCLLARRLIERGVRFVQLYHTDWDHHGGVLNLADSLTQVCREVDQPTAALIQDLKLRGLLDETLVVWGGEFGRTPMGESRETIGRDHHIDAYTMWLAGGGVKPGYMYGKSDEIGYNVVDQQVHVHDLQATILHQLGLDHKRLTYRFQGRDYRLTDVHGEVVRDIIA